MASDSCAAKLITSLKIRTCYFCEKKFLKQSEKDAVYSAFPPSALKLELTGLKTG